MFPYKSSQLNELIIQKILHHIVISTLLQFLTKAYGHTIPPAPEIITMFLKKEHVQYFSIFKVESIKSIIIQIFREEVFSSSPLIILLKNLANLFYKRVFQHYNVFGDYNVFVVEENIHSIPIIPFTDILLDWIAFKICLLWSLENLYKFYHKNFYKTRHITRR